MYLDGSSFSKPVFRLAGATIIEKTHCYFLTLSCTYIFFLLALLFSDIFSSALPVSGPSHLFFFTCPGADMYFHNVFQLGWED